MRVQGPRLCAFAPPSPRAAADAAASSARAGTTDALGPHIRHADIRHQSGAALLGGIL